MLLGKVISAFYSKCLNEGKQWALPVWRRADITVTESKCNKSVRCQHNLWKEKECDTEQVNVSEEIWCIFVLGRGEAQDKSIPDSTLTFIGSKPLHRSYTAWPKHVAHLKHSMRLMATPSNSSVLWASQLCSEVHGWTCSAMPDLCFWLSKDKLYFIFLHFIGCILAGAVS